MARRLLQLRHIKYMKKILKSKYSVLLFVAVGAFLVGTVPAHAASAPNFWISQNGSGTMSGLDAADAAPCDATPSTPQTGCAAFNNSANWGNGSAQIGLGTIVHLSGTINAKSSVTGCYLNVLGSGTSASPITIQFENGAILQSTAFGGQGANGGGAICVNGPSDSSFYSYIVINGQGTGTIQNTSDGTCLVGQAGGIGCASTESAQTTCDLDPKI